MKATRYKRAARILTVYRYSFALPSSPFAVIIDGTFAKAALAEKINLAEQLPKYLGGPVEIFTTKCAIAELELLESPVYGALHICIQQQVAPCPHTPTRTASECFAHLARRGKKPEHPKYIFGTQDAALTTTLRELSGVAIMYIAHKTLLLDLVSEATKKAIEDAKKTDLDTLRELKSQILGDADKKKKRKKKGVNPLSCKKKKLKTQLVQRPAEKTSSLKRRRRKKTGTVEASPTVE